MVGKHHCRRAGISCLAAIFDGLQAFDDQRPLVVDMVMIAPGRDGVVKRTNLDTIKENETIRDELLAITLGIWNHIKNGPPGTPAGEDPPGRRSRPSGRR